jgi:hypothetical protein
LNFAKELSGVHGGHVHKGSPSVKYTLPSAFGIPEGTKPAIGMIKHDGET